jgi:hypothetical protein
MLKILAIIAVVAIAQVPTNTPRQRGDKQDHASHDAAKGDSVSPPISPASGQSGAIVQAGQREPEKESSKKQPDYWKETFGPANLPNWALVIVGGLAGFLAWRTVTAVQLQAAAQMDADRAWVLVSVYRQPEEPLTGQIVKGIMPGLIWQVQIFGNTPAKITSEKHRCRIVSIEEGFFPPKPELESVPVYPSRYFVDRPIMYSPGNKDLRSIGLEYEKGMDVMAQIVAVTQAKAAWCAYGKIEYEDAFKRKGTTQFCAVYSPQLGGVIASPDGTVLNPPGFRIGGPPGYNYNT